MKEETKNTVVDEENNPYTVKVKWDVLGMIKSMELEDQEELIDWIIEKINERSSINITNDKIVTNLRELNQVTIAKDGITAEFIEKD